MDAWQNTHSPRDCVRRGIAHIPFTSDLAVIITMSEDSRQVAERTSSDALYLGEPCDAPREIRAACTKKLHSQASLPAMC